VDFDCSNDIIGRMFIKTFKNELSKFKLAFSLYDTKKFDCNFFILPEKINFKEGTFFVAHPVFLLKGKKKVLNHIILIVIKFPCLFVQVFAKINPSVPNKPHL